MAVVQITRVQHRRGTSGELPDALSEAEIGMTTDTGEVFIGAPNHPSVQNRTSYPYKHIKVLTELDVQYGITGDVYYHGPLRGAVASANSNTSLIPMFPHGTKHFGNLDFSLTASGGSIKVIGTLTFVTHPTDPTQSVINVVVGAQLGWTGGSLTDKFSLSNLNLSNVDTGITWLKFNNTTGLAVTLGVCGREWSTPVLTDRVDL